VPLDRARSVRAAKNDAALLLIAMDGHGHWRLRAKRLLHRSDYD